MKALLKANQVTQGKTADEDAEGIRQQVLAEIQGEFGAERKRLQDDVEAEREGIVPHGCVLCGRGEDRDHRRQWRRGECLSMELGIAV